MSEQELQLLRGQVAELQAEVAQLRRGSAAPPTAAPSSRRRFLRLAGAASAGAVGAAFAGSVPQAAASTGAAMIIGAGNSPTAATDSTALFNPSSSQLMSFTLRIANYSDEAVSIPASQRAGIFAYTSGSDSTGGYRVGVYSRSHNSVGQGGTGVFGSANGPESPFDSSLSIGVVGTGSNIGAAGYANGANAIGVLGSSTGLDLYAHGTGRVYMVATAAGAPATGAHVKGEMVRDTAGDLYLCVADGTPGTWRKAAALHPAYAAAGGTINLLAKPIRLFDSRGTDPMVPINHGGVKVAAGEQVTVQVAGTTAQGITVPAGAVAVLGNLTVTRVDGAGWATVWPSGPVPSTSSINYTTAHASAAVANAFVCGLSSGGTLMVACAQSAAHVILDITGFVY